MTERLCPDCQKFGRCLFRENADHIVAALKTQGITDQEILMWAALEVHKKIADERINARKKACPNLNNVNPDYPGKELL